MLRVTSQQQINALLGATQRIESNLFRVREMLASGKRVNRPSDDAAAYERISNIRNLLQKTNQRLGSINEGMLRLNTMEGALTGPENIVQRAKELALQQRNDTNSALERSLVAKEVQQLILGMVDAANTQVNGRFIFSGYETQTAAYAIGTVTASGVSTAIIANDANQGTTSSSIAIQDASLLTGQEYNISFTDSTTFDVINVTTGATVLSSQTYTTGANVDFEGLRVVLTDNPGGPLAGDEFSIPPHNASDATVNAALTPTITARPSNQGTTSSTTSVLTIGSLTGDQYQIAFSDPTTFDVVNVTTGATVLSSQTYATGANIDFDGIRVVLTDNPGGPATGDTFTIDPSDQSLLQPDLYEIRFTSATTFDVINRSTDQVLSTGNSYTTGSNIDFAGITAIVTDGTVSPQAGDIFRVRPGYVYQGDTGSIAIEVGDGKTVTTNSVGSRVFSGPNVDVIAILQDLHEALVTNSPSSLDTVIDQLDTAQDQLTEARADIGARVNRLEQIQEGLELLALNTQDLRSDLEDADLAKLSSDLATLETNLQATLLTLTRQFQISLLNFLR